VLSGGRVDDGGVTTETLETIVMMGGDGVSIWYDVPVVEGGGA
jgi:hypothetical protein